MSLPSKGRDGVAAIVPRGTLALLDEYVAILCAEAVHQNLIGASTVATLWERHIADSLQLLDHAVPGENWVDIGSGAGLPAIPIALADPARSMTLIEPRARRAAFLDAAIERLGLPPRVQIMPMRIERCTGLVCDVISARAVAPLGELFAMASHLAHENTIWLLPKGRTARDELAAAQVTWHGEFTLASSRTDPEAAIVIARQVRRRKEQ